MRAIGAGEAARRLAGFEHLDPRGLCGPGDIEAMCAACQCYEISGADGQAQAVYALTVRNGVVWVEAAAGSGAVDMTAALDAVVTVQSAGARAIGLQTRRPGLVAKLERRGYRVTGWILRRDLE